MTSTLSTQSDPDHGYHSVLFTGFIIPGYSQSNVVSEEDKETLHWTEWGDPWGRVDWGTEESNEDTKRGPGIGDSHYKGRPK